MRTREWRREFRRQMQSGRVEKVTTDYDFFKNETYMSVYLGSVMSLMPSGKYYTPWANSNVTESEALKDEKERERMENAASSLDAWLESGEGDPTDVFLCWHCPDFKITPEIRSAVRALETYQRYLTPEILASLTETQQEHNQNCYQTALGWILQRTGLLERN